MILRTARLTIRPLSLPQFTKMLQGMEYLEADLGLKPSLEPLDSHMEMAMRWLYNRAEEQPEQHLFYTNWQIILNAENIAIGSLSFKGPPDADGCVEIGYGTNEAYRCHGYMTEAVDAVCSWTLQQPKVTAVIAETEKSNIASQRVLEKCGMSKCRETEDCFWWHRYHS